MRYRSAWLPTTIDARVRGIAWLSLAVQIGIVGTGGAVRLTGSGLGCPTWPRCTAETFIVRPEQGLHGAIEFGNRLLTFVLAAVAVAAVLLVLRLRHTRPDLWRLSLALAAGIPVQAGLGGLTVLAGLNPWLVGAHYIASAVLVSLATIFVVRTRPSPVDGAAATSPTVLWLAWGAALSAALAIVLGVVTTGAGPHAGDAATPRNGLDLVMLEHLHSYPAYAMLALTLALALVARHHLPASVRPVVSTLIVIELAQIGLGVAQARLGVPAPMVGVHMVLACVVLSGVTAILARLHEVDLRTRPRVHAAAHEAART